MAVQAVSFRTLAVGVGNVTGAYVINKPYRLIFANAQHFHRGEVVAAAIFWDPDANGVGDGAYTWGTVTIDHGYGTEWQTLQLGSATVTTSASWRRTDPGTGRARGGGGFVGVRGVVPGAMHFLYVAPFDAAGFPDWYTYTDTIYPINGRHPYTKDRYTGKAWLGADQPPFTKTVQLIPDTASRIASLDALPPVLSS